MSNRKLENTLKKVLSEMDDIDSVATYDEVNMNTGERGLVVRMKAGYSTYLTIK